MDNLTALNDNAATARNQSFIYDKEDRLLKATQSGSGGYGVLDYTYDLNGNRLTRCITLPWASELGFSGSQVVAKHFSPL